jgi:drug/metabolite transporter (DMT)-like permease
MVIAGLVLGTLGVALLARGDGIWSGSLVDRLALIGSGLAWAIGSVIARDGARPASAAQSTAMQLAAGGAAVLALSLASGELAGWSLQQVTQRGVLSLAFLIVAGTVLGFGAYTWLLRITTPAAVGTYAFVNPVVALALAWAVGDEPFSARTVAAGLTVLGAVLLIWKSPGTRRKPRRAVDHRPSLLRQELSLLSVLLFERPWHGGPYSSSLARSHSPSPRSGLDAELLE